MGRGVRKDDTTKDVTMDIQTDDLVILPQDDSSTSTISETRGEGIVPLSNDCIMTQNFFDLFL